MAALLLPAVGGSGRETSVALSADHLLAVVLGCQGLERGFDDATAETENQVKSRFLKMEKRRVRIMAKFK